MLKEDKDYRDVDEETDVEYDKGDGGDKNEEGRSSDVSFSD